MPRPRPIKTMGARGGDPPIEIVHFADPWCWWSVRGGERRRRGTEAVALVPTVAVGMGAAILCDWQRGDPAIVLGRRREKTG